MTIKSKDPKYIYSIRVTNVTRAMIRALVEKYNTTTSEIIRAAIVELYKKEGNTTDER